MGGRFSGGVGAVTPGEGSTGASFSLEVSLAGGSLEFRPSMRMRTPGWQRIPKGEWILQQKARKADRSLGKRPAIGQECNHPKPQAPRHIVEGLTWKPNPGCHPPGPEDRRVRDGLSVRLYPPALGEICSRKEECLSRFILFGERSLRRALQQYEVHYHEERNHQGRQDLLLFPRPSAGACKAEGTIRCREHLGWLLKYYDRQAA